jgi:hypothetical protein
MSRDEAFAWAALVLSVLAVIVSLYFNWLTRKIVKEAERKYEYRD